VNAPLLSCRRARITTDDGTTLVSELDADADGTRVVLVGNWEPLFRLFLRTATLASGSVEVLGVPAHRALAEGVLGTGIPDATFAPSSKAFDSLVASARLAGLGKRAATRRAEAVLDELGLASLGKMRFDALDRAARRMLSIARAVLEDPAAIAIERPFETLEDDRALLLEGVLGRALSRRKLLLHLPTPAASGPEARALETADRVIALPSNVVFKGEAAVPLDSPARKLDS
jgi:ABC-type Na+ transport system ATPase subunit NatA